MKSANHFAPPFTFNNAGGAVPLIATQEIGWSHTDLGPLMNGRPVFTRALHPVNLLVRYRAIG